MSCGLSVVRLFDTSLLVRSVRLVLMICKMSTLGDLEDGERDVANFKSTSGGKVVNRAPEIRHFVRRAQHMRQVAGMIVRQNLVEPFAGLAKKTCCYAAFNNWSVFQVLQLHRDKFQQRINIRWESSLACDGNLTMKLNRA